MPNSESQTTVALACESVAAPDAKDVVAAPPLEQAPKPVNGGTAAVPPREEALSGSAFVNLLLVVIIVLLAGLTPVAARDALKEMPPISTGIFRFSVAAALLSATAWLRGDFRGSRKIERRDWPAFVGAAALCVPVNQASYLFGVKLANASHAGLFYALNPVLVFLLTLALGRVGWSRRMGLATLISFVGAAAIGWDGLRAGGGTSGAGIAASASEVGGAGYPSNFVLGDLCLLGAVLSWAGFTILIGPLGEKYGAIRSITITMVIGVLMYAPAYFVDQHRLDWSALSWRAVGGFVFIAVMTSYVNYVIWFVAMMRMGVNRLSIATNASPVVAVVAAYYWSGEPITVWLFVGAVFILLAITLANWDRFRALMTSSGRRVTAPAETMP